MHQKICKQKVPIYTSIVPKKFTSHSRTKRYIYESAHITKKGNQLSNNELQYYKQQKEREWSRCVPAVAMMRLYKLLKRRYAYIISMHGVKDDSLVK